MGKPNSVVLKPLQKIQKKKNFAARLVLSWHPANTTLHLFQTAKLHWLPISEYSLFNIKSLVWVFHRVSAVNGSVVLLTSLNCYMSTLRLVHYALLLTSACQKLQEYKRRTLTRPFRTFSCRFGVHIWNSLPQLRPAPTLLSRIIF